MNGKRSTITTLPYNIGMDNTISLGASFNTMKDLREALKHYGMTQSSPMATVISRPDYLYVQCFSQRSRPPPTDDDATDPDDQFLNSRSVDCGFAIRANKRKDNRVYIAKLQLDHSADCQAHRNASTSAIFQETADLLAAVPNVRPTNVINVTRFKHGATSTYSTAWRAVQAHRDVIHNTEATSFGKLPQLLSQIEAVNPGSTTYCAASEEGKFDRAFLCLGVMKNAFAHCRPMLIVDACHIKTKFGGVIMAASAHDGDGHLVPLAIGLYAIENEENWRHFFGKLILAIPDVDQPGITVMHDREKGLHQAQTQLLPLSHESICVWHLEKNVNAIFKSKFNGRIWAAAKAFVDVKYNCAMEAIAAIDPEAAAYLVQADPTRWASCHFPVPRFGTVTSNSAESLNSWMEEFRDQSHLGILAGWVSHTARLVYSRKQEYRNAASILSPRSMRKFNDNRDIGRRHQVFQTGDLLFEVMNLTSGTIRIVDLGAKTCSCREFQEMLFPCAHAAVAVAKIRQPIDRFVHSTYLVRSLQAVYSKEVISVDLETLEYNEGLEPPTVTRKAGRPRKIRLRSRGDVAQEDRYYCRQCGQQGHNSRTCDRRPFPTNAITPHQDEQPTNLQHHPPQLPNTPVETKRIRTRTVVCANCGANHYRKTPCRPAAATELRNL
jgi:hypothetical protein